MHKHTSKHKHKCTHKHTSKHEHKCTHKQTWTQMHTHMHAQIHTKAHTHKCMHKHILYTQMYAHTNVHTHMHTQTYQTVYFLALPFLIFQSTSCQVATTTSSLCIKSASTSLRLWNRQMLQYFGHSVAFRPKCDWDAFQTLVKLEVDFTWNQQLIS